MCVLLEDKSTHFWNIFKRESQILHVANKCESMKFFFFVKETSLLIKESNFWVDQVHPFRCGVIQFGVLNRSMTGKYVSVYFWIIISDCIKIPLVNLLHSLVNKRATALRSLSCLLSFRRKVVFPVCNLQ